MKVDGLKKYYRILAMMDWFEYVNGALGVEMCIESYYSTDLKEVKESIRYLYNQYWEILKTTFAVEPYQIDFNAHTENDCKELIDAVINHITALDFDKIDESSCMWDRFLREMTTTLINIQANSFIGTFTSPFIQRHPELDLDFVVSTVEENFGIFVKGFICKKSIMNRLSSIVSMLNLVRTDYHRSGCDIRTMMDISKDEEDSDPDTVVGLQKALDNIKEFDYYQSLFDELKKLASEDTGSDPLKLLEKYYEIIDEIYFNLCSLGPLATSLILKLT